MSDFPPQLSDEELVRAVVSEDRAAFGLLYDRHAQTVYALAAHLVGPDDAEEITQDVFLKLWQRAGQFDVARGTFKSWFLSMARNRALDELKRRSVEHRKQVASSINQMLTEALDPIDDALHNIWISEHQSTLLKVLADLPAEQRQVIIMVYFGGYSQSSIAEQLNWPLGTVKKRIRLGMKKLRIALAHKYEVE